MLITSVVYLFVHAAILRQWRDSGWGLKVEGTCEPRRSCATPHLWNEHEISLRCSQCLKYLPIHGPQHMPLHEKASNNTVKNGGVAIGEKKKSNSAFYQVDSGRTLQLSTVTNPVYFLSQQSLVGCCCYSIDAGLDTAEVPHTYDLLSLCQCSWAENRKEWKFQKTRQTWLLQHIFDSEKVKPIPRLLWTQVTFRHTEFDIHNKKGNGHNTRVI